MLWVTTRILLFVLSCAVMLENICCSRIIRLTTGVSMLLRTGVSVINHNNHLL